MTPYAKDFFIKKIEYIQRLGYVRGRSDLIREGAMEEYRFCALGAIYFDMFYEGNVSAFISWVEDQHLPSLETVKKLHEATGIPSDDIWKLVAINDTTFGEGMGWDTVLRHLEELP